MKYYISLVLFLFVLNQGNAQQLSNYKRHNVVFAEMGGAMVAGYGLGYERYINLKPKWTTSLRAGAGMIDHSSAFSSFAGGSLIFGKRSGLELGFNYLVNYDATTFRTTEEGEEFQNGLQTLIGYRYQNWDNGLMFRIFYVPPVGCCGSAIPLYGGASLGYAF